MLSLKNEFSLFFVIYLKINPDTDTYQTLQTVSQFIVSVIPKLLSSLSFLS